MPSHRLNQPGLAASLRFLSQIRDVNVHDIWVPIFGVPNSPQDFLTVNRLTRSLRQNFQKRELGGRKKDRLSSPLHFSMRKVDFEIAAEHRFA